MGPGEATKHHVGDLAEVLDNLGVFGMLAEDLVALCRSGFRRVPISQGSDYYLSIQGFTPNQIAYAHTHPDSEEWVIVLRGGGQALVALSVDSAIGGEPMAEIEAAIEAASVRGIDLS